MNTIEFRILQTASPCDPNDKEVRIFVDGQDYIGTDNRELGLHPRNFFRQSELLEGGLLTFARCSCGDIGCGSQAVKVARGDCEVRWGVTSAVRHVFNDRQYQDAVEKAKADTTWEDDEDTFQRLAGDFDYSKFDLAGWQLNWVSLRPAEERIRMYFRNYLDDSRTLLIRFNGEGKEDVLATLRQAIPLLGPEDFTPKS